MTVFYCDHRSGSLDKERYISSDAIETLVQIDGESLAAYGRGGVLLGHVSEHQMRHDPHTVIAVSAGWEVVMAAHDLSAWYSAPLLAIGLCVDQMVPVTLGLNDFELSSGNWALRQIGDDPTVYQDEATHRDAAAWLESLVEHRAAIERIVNARDTNAR